MSLFSPPGINEHGRRAAKTSRKYRTAEGWNDSLVFGKRPLTRPAEPTKNQSLWPMLALVVLFPLVMMAQLFNLQIVNGERMVGLADGNRLRQKVTYAPRGRILDRYGTELAVNTASFQVVSYPYLLPQDDAARAGVYRVLAETLDSTPDKIKRSAEAKGLDYTQPLLIKDRVAYQEALVIEQKLPKLPGVSLDGVPIREYLAETSLAHVLGYAGRASEADLKAYNYLLPVDFVGKDGVEAQYDRLLRGQNGVVETEVDAAGRPLRTLREEPTRHGQDVVLTIDYGLQKALAAAIAEQMPKAGVNRAAGVAIDPNTGEVLAMVSLPTYNNNLFSKGISLDQYDGLLSNPLQPLHNKAIAGGYPSGSIIKPMHLVGALQEGVVNENTVIVDRGKITIPNIYDPSIVYTFNGWNPAGLGPMNARRAIAMSSDIYFYTVGGGYEGFQGLGVERLTSYYRKFGLGEATGIDLPGEASGRVPTPEWMKATHNRDWVLGDTYNISIGQGDISTSPLQMAVATAAVINGGKVLEPHVFKATADGSVSQKAEIKRSGFIKPEYLQVAKEGMLQVIGGTTSTATFARVPVKVAGKSGTAETDPTTQRRSHAWYTAFAPYDKPEILFAVILEEGEGGSQFAAPAIAKAMEWYFTHRRP